MIPGLGIQIGCYMPTAGGGGGWNPTRARPVVWDEIEKGGWRLRLSDAPLGMALLAFQCQGRHVFTVTDQSTSTRQARRFTHVRALAPPPPA